LVFFSLKLSEAWRKCILFSSTPWDSFHNLLLWQWF
jgi:hypothetical protein